MHLRIHDRQLALLREMRSPVGMNAITRFIEKYWKRLLVAALGTAVASRAAKQARNRVRTLPLPEIPADTGPIVQEPTFRERLRRAVPKKKKRSGSGSGGGGASKSVPQTASHKAHNVFEEPTKKTPIPERPQQQSRQISEEAQRARDAARETARRQGHDGPDFGIGRNPR
jgi:hypothetical protein